MTHRGSGVMAETPPTTGAIGPKASCDPMPKIESREAPCCFLREAPWFFVPSVLSA
jgi:hypothetical protein